MNIQRKGFSKKKKKKGYICAKSKTFELVISINPLVSGMPQCIIVRSLNFVSKDLRNYFSYSHQFAQLRFHSSKKTKQNKITLLFNTTFSKFHFFELTWEDASLHNPLLRSPEPQAQKMWLLFQQDAPLLPLPKRKSFSLHHVVSYYFGEKSWPKTLTNFLHQPNLNEKKPKINFCKPKNLLFVFFKENSFFSHISRYNKFNNF